METKPITPTEAHLELAKTVIFSRDASGRLLTAPMAAQLIADSEARALAEIRDDFAKLTITSAQLADSNVSLRQERDQLRAEQAEGKVAEQGLTLACLCDGILGEYATDRSDQTLLRVGCAMKQELATEREKVRVLREACESICEEWGKDSNMWHIGAGNKMQARAEKALAPTGTK
jgi:hypothetical protein